MYYDKSQQGNSGRQMNDSKLRRKIMADDNVKFICSRNEDVLHLYFPFLFFLNSLLPHSYKKY